MADTPNCDCCFEGCMMRHFRIYTKEGCPHCVNAKALLNLYEHDYEEIVMNEGNSLDIIELFNSRNWKTFPMVFEIWLDEPNFVNESNFVGGFLDLKDYLDDEL